MCFHKHLDGIFTDKTFSITAGRQSDNNYSTYPSTCQPSKWDVAHTSGCGGWGHRDAHNQLHETHRQRWRNPEHYGIQQSYQK